MSSPIALVFDFDDTLAPDSTSGFLKTLGIDAPKFWTETVQPLVNVGWDPVPAYLHSMIGLGITKKALNEWGAQVPIYDGVEETFQRLQAHLKSLAPNVSLEFYLISSGIGDILRHTKIAHHFNDIWSCDFVYDDSGHACFPKRLVSFTDKTRYLFQISKGIYGDRAKGRPFDVNLKVERTKRRVPFNQMIFVGDGYTDIPCFSVVRKFGGISIGVYDIHDRESWGRSWGFIEERRVSNLVPADYSEKSALTHSLMMAIESMARRMELAEQTYQG